MSAALKSEPESGDLRNTSTHEPKGQDQGHEHI